MTVVHFNRKEFERHIKITKEIEEKLNLLGAHVEDLTSDELILEISPNRPDMLSLNGLLLAFKAFLGKEPGLKKFKLKKPQKDFEVKVDISVKNVRPYTACAIIKNITFNDTKIKEIIDIQEKIHATLGRNRRKVAIGIYPLEKLTLPIRYEAKKPEAIKFIPLDSDKEMDGNEILKEHPTGVAYSHLLKGKELFPVFYDSKGEVMSMPPIINSAITGKVTEETKSIFIECTGFDLDLLKKVLNVLVIAIATDKSEIYQVRIDYSDYGEKKIVTPDFTPEKIKVKKENVNKLLGINLQEKEIKKLLERMGYDYKNGSAFAPAWRTDIMHEVDLIEDIAIAYGYNNFIPELPPIATIGEEDRQEIIKRKISEMLIGLNMLELATFHLLTKEDVKKIGLKPEIEVETSKTEYSVLRQELISSVLKVLGKNIDAEYPQRVFEIGKVFKYLKEAKDRETDIGEEEHLVIAICPGNFTDIKQVLDYLAKMFNIEFKIDYAEHNAFIEGRCGKILINKKDTGIIGEIHPKVLKEWHIRNPVALLELNLEPLFSFS
ncbi:MAG: phenylalanine--tRNA ligase subunit beta [Candidatus Pacearchaeota archaeon]